MLGQRTDLVGLSYPPYSPESRRVNRIMMTYIHYVGSKREPLITVLGQHKLRYTDSGPDENKRSQRGFPRGAPGVVL